MPQLLAEALRLRIVLIQPGQPTATVGLRNAFNELLVGSERTVVMVQSVRQSHWDPALPLSDAAQPGGLRRRILVDAPEVITRQILEASEAEVARLNKEKASAEASTACVVAAMNRMHELSQQLQQSYPSHVKRARSGEHGVDEIALLLERAQAEQDALSTRTTEALFLRVTTEQLHRSTSELETLEMGLGGPLWPQDPINADYEKVLALTTEWMQQLPADNSACSWSFVDQVILLKQLHCIDQLLEATVPPIDVEPPHARLEIEAVLLRFLLHPRVWPLTVRLPCRYFTMAHHSMVKYAVKYFDRAARAAAPDLLEQARLLVDQCDMLQSLSLLRKATGLDSIDLVYPEEPFAVLHDLHARYPEAGPALSRDQLEQLDSVVRDWQSRIEELEARATRLVEREDDGVGAARLRLSGTL